MEPTAARPRWNPRFAEAHALHLPLRAAASRLSGCVAWPTPDELTSRLGPLTAVDGAAPVRFVDDPPRPRRRRGARALEDLYDARIALKGEVPTREGSWHDVMNALAWAAFPRAKRALSERQCALHRERVGERFDRLPPSRTPEQDALALVDEGGAVVAAAAPDVDVVRRALDAGRWAELDALASEGRCAALLFGHALHEHAVDGDLSPRACALVVAVPSAGLPLAELVASVDRALAAVLRDRSRLRSPSRRPAVPLDALARWSLRA